ncbi:hypothetical protein DUNSADRAFT_4843 [Dunaliella salina]|uniref:Secreted protein n=1 Tax=Dunaliella salina TaxID=3046 RepID=A0ABQ7GRA0_DUNSA|nr:hypothetical protein DUNSADRAFT_4843 [Dunaliella salina]|eukprot:KAF5837119.1 hypothetical protein DUNSADRAFT_4843 [Dunaliella salina]
MLLPVCLMAAASPRMGLSSYTRNMAETLLCKRNSSKRPGKHMQRVDLLHSKLYQRYSRNLVYTVCTTVHDYCVAYVRFYQVMYILRFLDSIATHRI